MEEYIVKKCGNSLHVILDKKRYKIGDEIQVISGDIISLNLLIGEVEDLKTRLKIIENGN